MAADYRRRQAQATRDRFLAGLLQLLREHDEPQVFWLEFPYGITNVATHWVRLDPDPRAHDRRLQFDPARPATPERKTERALFEGLGTVRRAISSTSLDTCCILPRALPAWRTQTRLERGELVAVLTHLLANPDAVLTDEAQSAILSTRLAGQLNQSLAPPNDRPPGPRL